MTLSEEVQKMILSALESMEVTSANPTHINTLIQVNNLDIGNLEQTLEEEIKRVIKELEPDKTPKKEDIRVEVEKIVKELELKRPDPVTINDVRDEVKKSIGEIEDDKDKLTKLDVRKEIANSKKETEKLKPLTKRDVRVEVEDVIKEKGLEKPKPREPQEERRSELEKPKLDVKPGPKEIEEKAKPLKELKVIKTKFKRLDEGNVGEVTRMSSAHFGNVVSFSKDPAGFLITSMFRKFARGAGVLLLATLIFGAVKFILDELFKPGRVLDRRFKRNINNEILAFRRREEKQKLKQGFARVIVTSISRLRGGEGSVSDTFRTIAAGDPVFTNDSFMVEESRGNPMTTTSKAKGSGRRFGR